MRKAAWAGAGLLAVSFPVALLPPAGVWRPVAGLAFLAGATSLATLLPWRTWFPRLAPMPELWRLPGRTQRWCTRCGRPAPRSQPCPECGGISGRQRRSERALHRKQRAASQEKKT